MFVTDILKFGISLLSENVIFFSMVLLIPAYIKFDKLKNVIPNAIASLGIIGTFVGIYVGLINFDVTPGNMEDSIPELLNGLKLAFFTSIIGLILSTILKVVNNVKTKKSSSKGDEVINLLTELIEKVGENDSSILKDSILELKSSTLNTNRELVAGIKELALANKKIAEEMRVGNEGLKNEFVNFRKEVAEAFTSEFTKALSKSIEDLNIQLQKHLGDNFKNSVDKLVTWQEHYMETITDAVQNLEKTKASVVGIEGSLDKISENSYVLLETAELIKPLLNGTENIQNSILSINKSLEDNLLNFAKLISEAGERSENSIESLNGVVLETSNNLTALKDNFEILGDEFQESFNKVLTEVQVGIEDVVKHSKVLSETSKAQIDNLEDVCVRLGNTSEQVVQELAEKLQESFMVADQAINESIKKVEEGLNTNLDNCLTGLVSALSSVSDKFVKDYSPLTDKLKKVVELAKAV